MAINDKVRELIKQLQAKLTNYQKEITLIQSQVEALKLKSPPQQNKITEVEQELTSLQSKLLVCQQEKEALQQALDEKVKELENSNLTKEEKATAIIKLTESNRSELNSVNEKLEKV
jgi:ribosome-associated translation inhibitor RaiA